MFKRLTFIVVALALVAPLALANTASKDGAAVAPKPGQPNHPSSVRTDWEYNTGGAIDFVPDLGGSHDGWGEWFITSVQNTTGQDIYLTEFGFPCGGPPTETYGWLVWVGTNPVSPPPGNAYTAEFFGPFTPTDPDPEVFPPTIYSYIDISEEMIVIPDGVWFVFGYDVTGHGGQTSFNGVETWAWYSAMWDPDVGWGRTAILQVKASFEPPIANVPETWGNIKIMYHR
jgi:hypothetical protein